jgi:hypothetical protein
MFTCLQRIKDHGWKRKELYILCNNFLCFLPEEAAGLPSYFNYGVSKFIGLHGGYGYEDIC